VIIFIFDLVTERKCDVLSLIAKITKILKIGLCDFLQAKFWRNQRLYNEGAKAVRIVRCEPHCLSRQAWFTSWKLMKKNKQDFLWKSSPNRKGARRAQYPVSRITAEGAEKSQQCCKYFLQQHACFRTTLGSNMGASNSLLAPGAI